LTEERQHPSKIMSSVISAFLRVGWPQALFAETNFLTLARADSPKMVAIIPAF